MVEGSQRMVERTRPAAWRQDPTKRMRAKNQSRMTDELNRNTWNRELTVMKLENKWLYTMVFPIHDGPREYDCYARKPRTHRRGRRHVSKKLD